MASKPCTNNELLARVVALEANLAALRQVLDERDERYKLRAASQDSAVKTAMDAADKALVKAETSTERRLEALNELRAMASDQAGQLMPRAEYQVQHQAMLDLVQANERRIGAMEARGGGLKDAWGYLVGVGGLLLAGLSVYFHRY